MKKSGAKVGATATLIVFMFSVSAVADSHQGQKSSHQKQASGNRAYTPGQGNQSAQGTQDVDQSTQRSTQQQAGHSAGKNNEKKPSER